MSSIQKNARKAQSQDVDGDDDEAPVRTAKKPKKQRKWALRKQAVASRKTKTTAAQNKVVYVEQCDQCESNASGQGFAVPMDNEGFKQMLEELVPGILTGPNQFKYPAATHNALIVRFYGESVRTNRDSSDYRKTPHIQYLRWVSTMAFAYLLCTSKIAENEKQAALTNAQQRLKAASKRHKAAANRALAQVKKRKVPAAPTEIQALWDGEKLYICENKNKCTQRLQSAGSKWWEPDPRFSDVLKNINAEFETRYVRHAKHLDALDGEYKKGLLFLQLSKHKKIEYVIEGSQEEKHAEIRLVEYWKTNCANSYKVYVAGVKRPCLACYCRLKVLAKTLKADKISLKHKQRPGLFWPSASALRDSTPTDRDLMAQHIADLVKLYVSFNDIYVDSDSEHELDEDGEESEDD